MGLKRNQYALKLAKKVGFFLFLQIKFFELAPPEFNQSGDGKQSFKYSLIKNSQIQLGQLLICYKET